MTISTALSALTRLSFLRTGWPWRSLGYVASTPLPAAVVAVPLTVLGMPWMLAAGGVASDSPHATLPTLAVLIVTGTVLMGAFGPLVALPLAALERRRLALVDLRPVPTPHRRPPAVGPWSWLVTRYTEPGTWRAVAYAVLLVTVAPLVYGAVGLVTFLIVALAASPLLIGSGSISLGFGQADTVPETLPYCAVGLLLLVAVPYLIGLLAGAHGALARALLAGPADTGLHAELVEVSRSRARLVDAFEAERRRIERDLHDGAQQRLVGLTLHLGIARVRTPADSPAYPHVTQAHDQAKQLMDELRDLIRGIHPRVLTDRGLPAALGELADSSPMPVEVDATLPDRLPAAVEGTAYFVVAEALANVARHSGATGARVYAARGADRLAVEIHDDGRGGADPARGSGLTGLADRAAAVGGRLYVSSPVGGPTLVRVELPCPSA
ncbi:sensor domain-containing protein [Longispora sp. NPDC051575]|uniref:sensor histidine kinase n=1 Tax=Longispora sp. NPDC051575 TaxID=3154943 RepID=UPI003422D0EC